MIKKLAIITLSALVLTSCGRSKPSNFYVLTPMSPKRTQVFRKHLNIGVGPVSLAQYLNKPEIVTRKNNNQLALAEFHRWGESLDSNITRVIGENITAQMPGSHAFNYPWTAQTPVDYQVIVDVRRFEMNEKDHCILKAQWSIYKKNSSKALLTHSRRYTIRTQHETDYRHIAVLMSRNLFRMSNDITADLAKVAS